MQDAPTVNFCHCGEIDIEGNRFLERESKHRSEHLSCDGPRRRQQGVLSLARIVNYW